MTRRTRMKKRRRSPSVKSVSSGVKKLRGMARRSAGQPPGRGADGRTASSTATAVGVDCENPVL